MTANADTHPGTTVYVIVAAFLTTLTAMEVTAFLCPGAETDPAARPVIILRSEIRAGRDVLHAPEIRPLGLQCHLPLPTVHRRVGDYLAEFAVRHVFRECVNVNH
jgi:hypothetical protein